MDKLVKAAGLILIALLILLDNRLSISVSAINLMDCAEGKILSGDDDGVNCNRVDRFSSNTYHQCFQDAIRSKNTWIVKTFSCPDGSIWDREHLACVEGTTCTGGGGGGGSTSEPLTPSPTPTDGPPLLTTTVKPGPGPTCPNPAALPCFNDPVSEASSKFLGRLMRTTASYPQFHGYVASTPIQTFPDGSTVLEDEWVANRGQWQDWQYCPEGMYAVGKQHFNYGGNRKGILYFNYLCQTPGGNEIDELLEALNPGETRPSLAKMDSNVCIGTVVGFQFRGVPDIAPDYLLGHCSTPVAKEKLLLTGRALASTWSNATACAKYQAMCGFRARMEPEKSKEEIRGLNSLQIKCCHVPDPWKDCVPTEERLLIKTCPNSKSDQGLRCEFEARIGLSLDYSGKKEEKELIFYSSIGYDFPSMRDRMKEKIVSKLASQSSPSPEYGWNEVDCRVENHETIGVQSVCVKPHESVEVHQIVGRCGYFLVRTNRFVKVVDGSEEYFDI